MQFLLINIWKNYIDEILWVHITTSLQEHKLKKQRVIRNLYTIHGFHLYQTTMTNNIKNRLCSQDTFTMLINFFLLLSSKI